jgi:unsaturated rhamnogalacturonyl hydrolase
MLDFEWKESSKYSLGIDNHFILELIANRYIGANPPIPFVSRAFSTAGILQTSEGLYALDFTQKYENEPNGSYIYAYCLLWSDEERSIHADVLPLGPVTIYHNSIQTYRSSVVEELLPNGKVSVPLVLTKGWNTLWIEARKTDAGFGCYIGAEEAKVRILQVLSPFKEREGQAGWVHTTPSLIRHYPDGKHPNWQASESETEMIWHPRTTWSSQKAKLSNLERIYGYHPNLAAYARASFDRPFNIDELTLQLTTHGATKLWLEELLLLDVEQAGHYTVTIQLTTPRIQHVLVWSGSGNENWGFELELFANDQTVVLKPPLPLHGYEGTWIYAGPFARSAPIIEDKSFKPHKLIVVDDQSLYWDLDAPSYVVRPYYENAMLSNKWTVGTMSNFARWDYPLGVTMYGLQRTADMLERDDIRQYAFAHIRSCTDWYLYSLWDYKRYGFPSINHQLVLMKMLDNCGSFGSAMLESYTATQDENAAIIAHHIANFMMNTLERKEDGSFYRSNKGEYFSNTIWADDLYMSTPFLVRYARLFNKPEALDLAAQQFVRYRSYLFIEDEQLMSHVYDFKYGKATRIPWGRGNGWVLFSLSELLVQLPPTHEHYDQLLAFYQQFVQGLANHQHETGLWHQVVNEHSSYLEASCTAMFIYGIARGIRYGWLADTQRYYTIVEKAWDGLATYAIDRHGHVYKVCSGSRYSFAPDYYMYDLRTVINDNHGIGIMMLAAVEVELLRQYFVDSYEDKLLQKQNTTIVEPLR